MRSAVLAVAALAWASSWTAGCAPADRPYRFASPMLGTAALPPAALPGSRPAPPPELANREAPSREARAIRVVSAPRIREASAAAAERVAEAPVARPIGRAQLAAPHREPRGLPAPAPRSLEDLRARVGRRDPRDPVAIVVGWARDLGRVVDGETGPALVAWAEREGRLGDPEAGASPGDLLVFDHATSDARADLIAIVIGRDERGVFELVYVGGGVIRRGFVDPARPRTKRDGDGRIVNTFLRHGRRWPAKGTRYLAGELLGQVIRTR